MIRLASIWLAGVCLALPAFAAEDAAPGDFAAQREQVLALGALRQAPAWQAAEGFAAEQGLRAIYFEALPWQGKPTKVFAWLGLPAERDVKVPVKVPGVVLVHGGGGTAYKEWVQKWTARGFAAISIAVEGQTDQHALSNARGWQRHTWAGPARVGIYGDSATALPDQWMYHAVADTVLANSLLRSLPEVDADNVGLMGISWGGVVTSTVIGIDARFAFAIPTYGCGHLFDAKNQYGQALGTNELYKQVWDPLVRMNRATMPVLWFSWPEDKHFPLDCQAACYRAAPGKHMLALVPGLGHGHSSPWNAPDSYAFAHSIVGDGQPWCVQTSSAAKAGIATATFTATRPLGDAVLVSTTDAGVTGDRHWIASPAEVQLAERQKLEQRGQSYVATAALPAGTTAWFLNVRSGKLTASSDYCETDLARPKTSRQPTPGTNPSP